MRTFVIADSSRRKAEPVGVLIWEEDPERKQGRFILELSSECSESDLPLSLAFCTKRVARRATPEESEDWVRSRIVPEDRHNIVEVLRSNGLAEYDEVSLLASSKGRSSDDDFLAYEVAVPDALARELAAADAELQERKTPDGAERQATGLVQEQAPDGAGRKEPGQVGRQASDQSDAQASSRADKLLAAVKRSRSGHEATYAFVELPQLSSSQKSAGPVANAADRAHSPSALDPRKAAEPSAAKLIGAQIRQRRRAAGLTQKQLAARAGITQAMLSRIESGSGNPTLALLEDVASALGAQLDISL